jgi:hypothetical protein
MSVCVDAIVNSGSWLRQTCQRRSALDCLDCVGAKPGNFANPDFDLLAIRIRFQHGHVTAPDFGLDTWLFQMCEGNMPRFSFALFQSDPDVECIAVDGAQLQHLGVREAASFRNARGG